MAQYARPNSTPRAGPWTAYGAATLHECIDEVTPNDDTDYITVHDGSVGSDYCKIGLSAVADPEVHTGHIVRFRVKSGGGSAHRGITELYQGSTGIASGLCGTWSYTGSWATFECTLSEADAAKITDYSDLFLLFWTNNFSTGDVGRITWAELEVPDALAAVSQQVVTNIRQSSATGNGNVTALGMGITQHGHCWSTSPNPDISDDKTELGAKESEGAFTSSLTELLPHTTYYIRAYVTDSVDTYYSNELTFKTSTEILRPNAAGDQCVFPDEAGDACPDHYKNVDEELPDDDTTWVGAETAPGDEPLYSNSYELYNIDDHVLGIGKIYQIKVYFRCKAQDTPTRASAKAVLKTGGTVYAGTSKTVTTSWADYSQVWTTNPDTGNPWTWSEIDALQAGVALRRCQPSGVGRRTYCTQVYVEVEYGIETPTATTDPATSVEEETAIGNGNMTNNGGEDCDKRGVCWNTTGNPTVADDKSEETDSFGTGTFSRSITDLLPGTKYYIKAYAHNSAGYGYGGEESFTTKPNAPSNLACVVQSTSQIDVSWTKGAGATKTMVRRKVESYPSDVTDGDQAYYGTSNSFNDTGLDPGKHYYYRAWSWVEGSDIWSDDYAEDNAWTLIGVPTVTTNEETAISQMLANLNGTLDDDGGEDCECGFEWGPDTNYGVTTPTESKVTGETFSQVIHGLYPGTTYHFRAFATNSAGTGYGADRSFTSTPLFSRGYALSRQEL